MGLLPHHLLDDPTDCKKALDEYFYALSEYSYNVLSVY